MNVVQLPTRQTHRWDEAVVELRECLERAENDTLNGHAGMAARFIRDAGQPTMVWANRIAAVQILATRHADVAMTIKGRANHRDVASAAAEILALASEIHGVEPDLEAQTYLAQAEQERVLI